MKDFYRIISQISIISFVVITAIQLLIIRTQKPVPANVVKPVIKPPVSKLSDHNKRSDCWISYGGRFYDITPFFGQHPGGDALLSEYCGKDATVAFDSKPHSQSAKSLLSQYLLK